MKRYFKFFGIIAIVAVIGFTFIACDDDSGDNPIGDNPIGDTPDPLAQFNGVFWRLGIYDGEIWIFDGTNKAQRRRGSQQNFSYLEINLQYGSFLHRKWDSADRWENEGYYSFDDSGNLKIGDVFHLIYLNHNITPTVPTDVRASAAAGRTSCSVTLKWTFSNATEYYVYRSSSSSDTYVFVGSTTLLDFYEDTELTANTTYYYKVSALNNTGESSQSESVSVTTPPLLPSPPGQPQNLRITSHNTSSYSPSFTVSWDMVLGATSYRVYYYRNSETLAYIDVSSTICSLPCTNPMSFISDYTIFVTARNAGGESRESSRIYHASH
jgi:hypothetical protein